MQTIKAKLLIALTPIVVVALIVAMLFVGASSDDSNTANAATACGVATAPGGGGAPAAAGGSSFGGTTFTADQLTVASQIVATLKGLGAAPKAYVLALQTAMQESTLNPKALNGNATGPFQQIAPGPNGPDGKPAYAGYDRTDPVAATGGFWKILQLRVPDYATTNKTNDAIIESIQASGQQEQYVKHQTAAEQMAAALSGVAPGAAPVQCAAPAGGPQPVTATGSEVTVPAIPDAGPLAGKTLNMPSAVIAAAIAKGLSYLGTTYSWGGGTAAGPSKGITDGGVADSYGDYNKVGFDCSGLTLFVWAQLGVKLPRVAAAQYSDEPHVAYSQALPGDLIFFDNPGSIHHVAILLGVTGGTAYMLQAPQSGSNVNIVAVYDPHTADVARPAAAGPS